MKDPVDQTRTEPGSPIVLFPTILPCRTPLQRLLMFLSVHPSSLKKIIVLYKQGVLTLFQTIVFDMFNLRTFKANKINEAQKLKFSFGRMESIVGKGKNTGYQDYFLFQGVFLRVVKSPACLVIISSKPLAAFPHKHCRNNRQR